MNPQSSLDNLKIADEVRRHLKLLAQGELDTLFAGRSQDSIDFMKQTLDVGDVSFDVPDDAAIRASDHVEFLDGRGYTLSVVVPVSETSTNLTELVVEFEVFNDGTVILAYAVW